MIAPRFVLGSGLGLGPVLRLAALLALALGATLVSAPPASAVGEGCFFESCPDSRDYCSIPSFVCRRRPGAGDGCVPLVGVACQPGLVCDARGECRHSPPRAGEPCGVGVSCASGLACNAAVLGRCEAQGNAGESCIGIGQGSCRSGLVCDAIGECRNSPPRLGQPCGLGVSCASGLACNSPIGGRCVAQGNSGDSCIGIGQGSCRAGLVCDVLGECRSSPPEFGEPCGVGVSCASGLACSAAVGGRCREQDDVGEACIGLGQGSCVAGLVCDALGECRNDPPRFGQPCGVGVPCDEGLACNSPVAGRCALPGQGGEACIGFGQGSCADDLLCDITGVCRHVPSLAGEPCGTGVPCTASLGCSAEIGGLCEERDGRGETCSGIGQGSCRAGLVCDFRRECRSPTPQENEPCGIGVPCAAGLFCQGGTQRCKKFRTVGEGCSAFNPCRSGLSCQPCLLDGCDHPLQCFNNANDGAISEQTCRALYSPALHQGAMDVGLAQTYGAGNSIGAVVSESQEFGVAYGPDGSYGCYTSLCLGAEADVEITGGFLSVGFFNDFGSIGGSSTSFLQEAEIAQVLNFNTAQIFQRNSLDPFDLGPLIGTADCFSVGLSAVPFPFSAGVYACETVLDLVSPTVCGNGFLETGEACDDGNGVSGDGCSSECATESLCGNGERDMGEACDDGNGVSGDGCSGTCQIEAFCGNGEIDGGEGCDDGGTVSGDGCSATCAIEAVCGNGIQEPGEECDDGNTFPMDGCSVICAAEMAGDLDGDRDIDRDDLAVFRRFRNGPATLCPTCDVNGDGMVTGADTRAAVLLCTRPRCATSEP